MEEAISEAIFDTVSQLGYTAVKPEQLQVIAGVLNCSDVFAVLPCAIRTYAYLWSEKLRCVTSFYIPRNNYSVLVSPDPSAGSRVWLRETTFGLGENNSLYNDEKSYNRIQYNDSI